MARPREFIWHPHPVPECTKVRQVYGFLFAGDGRLLIRVDGAKNSLPGGKPQPDETSYSGDQQATAAAHAAVAVLGLPGNGLPAEEYI